MIEGLKPYAEYKDSGLPWASRIPTHWSLVPNRAVLKRRKVLVGEQHRDYKLLSLTKKGLVVRDISTGKGKFSSDLGTSQEVRKGDLVFCLFDIPETPRTVGLSAHDGMITSAYTVFESTKLTKNGVRYLEKFYLALDDQKLMSPLYSGLRNTIAPPRFLGTKTPLPPPDEQAAIVRFLDHANRKIDRFIRVKRKLIGLLNEQKQAIVHRAVTRGLDPNVALKPSGFAWLGDIPAHWEAVRCGTLFREVVDIGHSNATLLSIDRFKGIIPQCDTGRRTRASNDRGAYKRVKPGQFAYNLMNAFMGALGFSQYDGIISPAYAVAQPLQVIDTNYFHFLFRTSSYTGEFNRLSYGIMYERNRLYFDRFKLVRALLPPLGEQKTIAEWINANTGELTTAITRTEREIALMQEYRTRLTSDIVTGKLDVREAAAGLPELGEEAGIESDIPVEFEEPEAEETDA